MWFLGLIALLSLPVLAELKPDLEQLIGVSADARGLTFQVPSNGCTEKDHFEFQVEERLEPLGPMLPALEHHYYISASRKTSDNCENFQPYGTQFLMSFDELGIHFGKFHVNNPIGGDKSVNAP
ncbi:MAG TPA: hypothetical protein VEL47_02985 [Myxococcota bacterium]|nr:hypothetical protein [Myxococcota bacterium]